MRTVFRAAYVATMAGPVIEDGAVVVGADERIAETGRWADLHAGGAKVVDLGRAIVLPGLVNAHTHLELTAVGQLPRPASFVDWVLELRERAGAVLSDADAIRASTAAGIAQSVRFGVTAVGDITLNPAVTRAVLRESALHGVSFGEVLGMAGRAEQMTGRLEAAIHPSIGREDLREGIEPHAPYSLDLNGYRVCLGEAMRSGMPLATHLAETADEASFLADHAGPFRRLWEVIGGWRDDVSRAAGGPIRAMEEIGLLAYPGTVLAHVNYVDEAELGVLARGRASVVYCPRTHEYFGHPPHRFAEMLGRGINVAVGTDSAASSPDLNLMADLRLIHRRRPDVLPQTIFEMGTVRGARALGMRERVGTLEAGKVADLIVFDVSTHDPLVEILEGDTIPRNA